MFVVQVFIPVGFVVFSGTLWDSFFRCLTNIIVKLSYNNVHISVVDLQAASYYACPVPVYRLICFLVVPPWLC